jgi:hypothetical protein
MDTKKRRTELRHVCDVCGRSYSRSWVLKRHRSEQHGLQQMGYSPWAPLPRRNVSNINQDPLEFAKFIMQHDQTFNKDHTNSKTENLQETVRSASKLAESYEQAAGRFVRKWCDLYYPLPKDMISGFSCNVCHKCLTKDYILPIKDIGFDLICLARHRCKVEDPSSPTATPEDRLLKLTQLGNQMFQELSMCIDFWIPGKRLIVANKIAVPDGNGKSTDRAYVQKHYGIHKKYYLEEIDFNRSPWLRTLFDNGKIEPTAQQLIDYCAYCHGTYAILQSPGPDGDSFRYYSVFLAPPNIIIESTVPLEPGDFFRNP